MRNLRKSEPWAAYATSDWCEDQRDAVKEALLSLRKPVQVDALINREIAEKEVQSFFPEYIKYFDSIHLKRARDLSAKICQGELTTYSMADFYTVCIIQIEICY